MHGRNYFVKLQNETYTMQISNDYKQKVVQAMLDARKNFGGTATAFSKQFNIHESIFSRLKKGDIEGILKDAQWLNIGRLLNVSIDERQWKFVKTDVVKMIEEEILFCQTYSKARILVDEPEIGKSFAARYFSRTLKNCFYLDCSQAKSKKLFISRLAQSIGVDGHGKLADVMENIKYSLRILENPIVMLLSICQRYKMKANHNQPLYRLKKQRVIINMSKIQNES